MGQRKGRFCLGGVLHPYFRNLAVPLGPKTRLDDPAFLAWEQLRMLNDVQESALTYQAFEIADRVAAEFLVVKIQPEPNSRTAVIDVEGAGFGISGDDKKYEQGVRELDPFSDSGVLGDIK